MSALSSPLASDARPQPTRYGRIAIALHWLMAALLFAQWGWGEWMVTIPKSPPGVRAEAFNLHKSTGVAIGALVLLRLGWRLRHRPPSLPHAVPRWQQRAAHANHAALYVAVGALVVTGYLGSSFSPYPIRLFGVEWPKLAAPDATAKALMSELHWIAGIVLAALILLHVGAAAWHAWRGDGVVRRMLPGSSVRR
jgi:cytochrome b561